MILFGQTAPKSVLWSLDTIKWAPTITSRCTRQEMIVSNKITIK